MPEKSSANVPAGEAKSSKQKTLDAEHVNDFINTMTSGGRAHVVAEHDDVKRRERHVWNFMLNMDKNRFSNILLFNEGAVRLKKQSPNDGEYIHATEIKGKYGHFVMAQAPRQDTLHEWYRMMWQCNVRVVVCLLPLDNPEECYKYFEKKQGKKVKKNRFTAKTFAVRPEGPATIYELRFFNYDIKGEERERIVHLVHFDKWPLTKLPEPRVIIQLVRMVWSLEQSHQLGHDQDSSVLVHGCSGVRRTGTFVLASMLCKQIADTKTVSVLSACATVRRFRYGVIRSRPMFGLILLVVLLFSADQGIIDKKGPQYQNAEKKVRTLLGQKNKTRPRGHSKEVNKTEKTAKDEVDEEEGEGAE